MSRSMVSSFVLALSILVLPVASPGLARAQDEPEFGVRATVEAGLLGVLDHDIQLGRDGTWIDYPSDGAQNNLSLFARVQGELDIWRQHRITFLYQPLDLVSQATLRRSLLIDGLTFPEGESVRFRYGFPFWRVGWSFDVLGGRDEELSLGLALQIRNATIEFESTDGSLYRARTDVGPVPLLRVNGRFTIADRWWFGWELDGFYAPISGLNGSDTDVEGAIVDASVRVGVRMLDHVDAFVNVRYLAGGASGQGDPQPTSDGWQENWLHFLAITVGATIDSRPR